MQLLVHMAYCFISQNSQIKSNIFQKNTETKVLALIKINNQFIIEPHVNMKVLCFTNIIYVRGTLGNDCCDIVALALLFEESYKKVANKLKNQSTILSKKAKTPFSQR